MFSIVALNHQNIKNNPERIKKPFINQYDWKEVKFPPHEKDWKKFEFALEIFYVPHNTKEIRAAYKLNGIILL